LITFLKHGQEERETMKKAEEGDIVAMTGKQRILLLRMFTGLAHRISDKGNLEVR
jgi:hypothetical protein